MIQLELQALSVPWIASKKSSQLLSLKFNQQKFLKSRKLIPSLHPHLSTLNFRLFLVESRKTNFQTLLRGKTNFLTLRRGENKRQFYVCQRAAETFLHVRTMKTIHKSPQVIINSLDFKTEEEIKRVCHNLVFVSDDASLPNCSRCRRKDENKHSEWRQNVIIGRQNDLHRTNEQKLIN